MHDEATVYTNHPYVVATPKYFPSFPTDSVSSLTQEGVLLGKTLFNDMSLSGDGKIACASCHNPTNAFSDPNTFSFGVGNQKGTRQAMALINLAYEAHYFWDGRRTSIATLVQDPITRHDEMGITKSEYVGKLNASSTYPILFKKAFNGQSPSFELAQDALSQFVRSLVSFKSKYDAFLNDAYTPTVEEQHGMTLFFTHPDPGRRRLRGGNCGDCHQNITLSGRQDGYNGFRNNGLPPNPSLQDIGLELITNKPTDKGKFRVPTLRNIALTAPYMHDGRFSTLQEVLDHYNSEDLFSHPGVDTLIKKGVNSLSTNSLGLTDAEKADIITFLHMLTDTSFVMERK